MVLLTFQITVLLMAAGCWLLYNRLPTRRPWSTPPFVSRAIRRCKAVPSFFWYLLFDEIDDLKARCDYLDKDADRYAKQADEDARDRISWINTAHAQTKLMLAADKDALELHQALMQAYDAKVFWQKQCYLLAHFSEWERGVPEDDSAATSNVVDYYDHGSPCPPPEMQAPGPHERNPRYPCESNINYPPDAWRPSNEAQPSLTCHLRDGYIISLRDDEVSGEHITFHRDLACQHVREYIAHNKHKRAADYRVDNHMLNVNPNVRFMIPCRTCFPGHRHHDIYHFDPVQLMITFQRILWHAVGQIHEFIREHPMGYGHGITPRECQAMIPRLTAHVVSQQRGMMRGLPGTTGTSRACTLYQPFACRT